ncbi:hypothetical protein [Mesonia sp. HuA40]|uniref:hypothetical protein n=1 Tax=Mesonia sp. HuA40 TaxID=2602761 RepID=UPI0011C95ABD|nr:hypothetical protein [Mesonia sp. HuA40]TXK70960.1 hypothetical protein FT993_10265 [Mesonia sp. HuA40]
MNNPKAQKLIAKILDELNQVGIIANTLVADLKELRPFAVEEKRPVVAKALRLAYEHIEETFTFDIPIPEEEPIEVSEEDELEEETMEASETESEFDADQSMIYFINLIKDSDNKLNIEEIREYNEALQNYEF